ncbi:MYO3B-like protein, partial [Mya arenaria]
MRQDDDLSNLEVLDEGTIVHALRARFQHDHFCTYIGDILVAVNPCKSVPIFDEQPPHLFWVADAAYRELLATGRNQVILVSGESGAGKTESTKYMIRHLMYISPSDDTSLLDKIVQVNPLLEAFGNAATVMNGNSSRFGKFIELSYTPTGNLLGAKIDDYILEKSRVVHRSRGEKNFHVFYALFAGMSRERLLYYFLEDPECHRIMRDAEPGLGVFRDPEEFQYYRSMFHNLTAIMTDVGFSDEHITLIFLVLAAILHLANIVFVPCEETDGVSVVDEYPLHAVAKLLGVEDEVQLTEALISTVSRIKGERIQSWKNEREANDGRDALAKELYSRLFGWIVGQVNRNLTTDNVHRSRGPSIGLLDMSGFENFPCNGFDQFLINVTNERLQQYFMDYIFPREQLDYEREGITWTNIEYHSNEDVLNLVFQKPHGILRLLDEESHFPQSTDASLVHKLKTYSGASPRFRPIVGDNCSFSIQHFAEQVTYDARGFLERNRDNLSVDLVTCLLHSNNNFIRDLFTAYRSETGTISEYARHVNSRPQLPDEWPSTIDPRTLSESVSRKASLKIKKQSMQRTLSGDTLDSLSVNRASPTVTKHFKRSLTDLMEKLDAAQPLFVRCVKPNAFLSAGKLDSELVRRQLLCNGLMELAQLRRNGFPVRIVFQDFVQRYGVLAEETDGLSDYERTMAILKANDVHGFQIGISKIFLKAWQKEELENRLREKLEELARLEREREEARQREAVILEHEREKRRREEHHRRELQRQQDELDALERRRASRESLVFEDRMTDSPPASTPRRSLDSGIVGYTDTDALLKEKLARLKKTDDGILESIATSGKRAAPPPPVQDVEDNGSLPPKRQTSQTSEDATTTSYESEGTNEQRPYDIFQVSEREFEENDAIFKEILKLVRLFMYVLMFVAILAGAVTNKLSLLLLVSGLNKEEETRGEHVTLLLLCMCCPIAFSWFMSAMKTLFGGKEWPSLVVVECLQGLGACLLMFRVLPTTDVFRGTIVTFAVCQVPSLLNVIVRERRPNPSVSEIVAIIMNVLAFFIQVGAIPFFINSQFFMTGNHTMMEGVNSTTYQNVDISLNHELQWEIPVGLLLFSVGYWENYVSGDWTIFGKIRIPFKQWRRILQDSRDTAGILVYPWKIGLMVLLARLLTLDTDFRLPETPSVPENSTETVDSVEEHFTSYSLMYLQLGSGIAITYLSGLACKLHMQRVAFSLSIMLAPPVTLAVVYLQCSFRFMPAHWHMGGWFCPLGTIEDLMLPIICAGALWISYAIVTSHIWLPQSERMAKLEKLFITPHFEGIFSDFTLTLRRRRNDKEIKVTGFDTFRYVGEDSFEDGVYNTKPNVIPQIYACATMWHETRQEMTQLLKSMFRLDYVHCASRLAQEKFRIKDPDYYDFEIHVIFDDAFELNDDVDKFVPNQFVKNFMECMEDAARSVVKGPIIITPPTKYVTPYGGRLVWTMPGHTKMVVHVKDKNKIRHRKRWSQCMYMYYLLGFRLFGARDSDKAFADESELESHVSKARNRKKKTKKDNLSRPIKSLFNKMDPETYEMAENTFILTLDGDVDFRPESVKLLIDRMKKNRKVGAVCGRIHPIGSGEDRWLCTLLLQQGHRIDYCAGADALTFAPETFNEFFNQRRRWAPSTLANMMDLLSSWHDTVRINDNISRPYVLYQFILMASTILAPSTIILMITGSYHSVLGFGIWESYLLSILPVGVYITICMTMKSDHQITAAAAISAIFTVVMMIATVGTIIKEKKKKKESRSILNRLGLHKLVNDSRELIQTMMGIKVEKKETCTMGVQTEETKPPAPILKDRSLKCERQQSKPVTIVEDLVPSGWEPNPDRPYWTHMEYIGNGRVEKLDEDEMDFWRFIIKKYLHPLDEDKSHKDKIAHDLIQLKNNVVFIYFMINFLWTIITLQLQTMEDKLKDFYIINKYEPLSLMFLSVFAFCITLQFISMFVHRWGTFLHLMSSTRIDWFQNASTEEDFVRFVVAEAQRLQRLEPAADYDELPPDYEDDDEDLSGTMTPGTENRYNEIQRMDGSMQRRRSSRRHVSSSGGDNAVPLLQQIFEDRLENIHRKWKQGSLAFRNNRIPSNIERNDSYRFSNKFNDMRQRMYKRSFKKTSNSSLSDDSRFNGVVIETRKTAGYVRLRPQSASVLIAFTPSTKAETSWLRSLETGFCHCPYRVHQSAKVRSTAQGLMTLFQKVLGLLLQCINGFICLPFGIDLFFLICLNWYTHVKLES